jgi:hypothetical protein
MDADELQERAVMEALPREFLADIALHYVNRGGNGNGYGNIGGCEYHEHQNEERQDCIIRVVDSLEFR